MKIKKAIKILQKTLKKDESYYYGWQANIAMAIFDEFRGNLDKDLLTSANNAAKRFLDDHLIR